jgi:ribulose kinase
MEMDTLQNGLSTAIGEVSSFVRENPVAVGLGTAGIVGVGAGIVAIASTSSKRKSKKKSSRKSKKSKKSKSRKLKFGSKAYRKKYLGHKKRKKSYSKVTKRTSHKRIRYTKNNQPYIILPSGKARFIKKTSARQSKKRKGGRY